jgi:hypothetical protein
MLIISNKFQNVITEVIKKIIFDFSRPEFYSCSAKTSLLFGFGESSPFLFFGLCYFEVN